MSRKMYTAIAAAMLLSALFVVSMNIIVHADAGSITIQSNGAIVPANGVITTSDNVTYTVQSDTNMSIIVRKTSIILNGNGHVLQCGGQAFGIGVEENNVTITNLTVKDFVSESNAGMSASFGVSYTKIYNCTITNNFEGINFDGNQNSFIYNNQILSFNAAQAGIWITNCVNISIAYNNFTSVNAGYAISLYSGDTFIFRNNFTGFGGYVHEQQKLYAANNIFTRNIFINSGFSFGYEVANNTIYHNDFFNSSTVVHSAFWLRFNTFDKGYPSCGNFWASHNLTDVKKGKYQNESGSDHIADNAYNISYINSTCAFEVDHYPLNITYLTYSDSVLVKYLNLSDVNDDSVVNMRDIAAAIYASGTKPGDAKWNWFADVNGDFRIDNADITWIQQNFNKRFP